MAVYIHGIEYALWNAIDDLDWLTEDEVPAAAVASLKAKNNELSLFLVDDSRPIIARIAVAIRLGSDKGFTEFGYAILSEDVINNLPIARETSPGETWDTEANRWHLALVQLTGATLNEFAKAIWHQATKDLVTQKDVISQAKLEIQDGTISKERLNKRHREQLDMR